MKTVLKKLNQVQANLKAPKGQYNSFGKYKYRSNEDILEGVKPHLQEVKAVILQSDDVTICGDRVYIKATSRFICTESGEEISTTSLARESLSKKGMDDSQISGTASSYARKYSLNGLLLIDDTKDADTQDNRPQPQQRQQVKPQAVKPKEPTMTELKTLISACSSEEEILAVWAKNVRGTKAGKTQELKDYAKAMKDNLNMTGEQFNKQEEKK